MDSEFIKNKLSSTSKISGPWKITILEKHESPDSYIFSEEHSNFGSCPEETSVSSLFLDILKNTSHSHLFIEHFVHAESIKTVSENDSCSIKPSSSILNHLRNCLEIMRTRNSENKDRIHFVDPRMEIVSILPDGRVYQAIKKSVESLIKSGDDEIALLTLYEAFIHPLLNLFPDKLNENGRLSCSMSGLRKSMTKSQMVFFDTIWKNDVVTRIETLNLEFRRLQKISNLTVSDTENIYLLYRDMTNKFLDTWLLSRMFSAQNDYNMSASILYLGSLHSLNLEKYLQDFGYTIKKTVENKNLSACLHLK